MNTYLDVEAFAQSIELDGENTISLIGEDLRGGHMMILPDCELRVKMKDLSWILPAYVSHYGKELASKKHCLSGWIDEDGLVCLSVTKDLRQ